MRPRVLFLCVHNSARSQIAEGLLRARVGESFEVQSAGSEPTQIHPFALRVLRDEGIDPSGQHSKSVSLFGDQYFDYVITLCADEICPIYINAGTRLHWGLEDPAASNGTSEEKLAAFQLTVKELKGRIEEFIDLLAGPIPETNARR